jgi:hypothetical protein
MLANPFGFGTQSACNVMIPREVSKSQLLNSVVSGGMGWSRNEEIHKNRESV